MVARKGFVWQARSSRRISQALSFEGGREGAGTFLTAPPCWPPPVEFRVWGSGVEGLGFWDFGVGLRVRGGPKVGFGSLVRS